MMRIIGFVIWSMACAIFLGFGVSAWKSEWPVGFLIGIKPPKTREAHKYNHSVAALWIAYAIAIELIGVPVAFYKKNPAGFIPAVIGIVTAITMTLGIAYLRIAKKYWLP